MSQTTQTTQSSTMDHGPSEGSGPGGGTPDLVATAKEESAQVTREAKDQVRGLWQQARSELTTQAASQQSRAAQGLRGMAEQLSAMADQTSSEGPARDLVATAAHRGREAAEWLDSREPGSLLEEARRFARRRPGAFLAIAAGVGVVAGRLSRSLGDDAPVSGADRGVGATTTVGVSRPMEPGYDPVAAGTETAIATPAVMGTSAGVASVEPAQDDLVRPGDPGRREVRPDLPPPDAVWGER